MHTNSDNVYIYDITNENLKDFGKFFIINIHWYSIKNQHFLVFATNTSIELFDDKFIKKSEYKFSENEFLEKSHVVRSELNFVVNVNNKTYILDETLKLITVLDKKYISIAKKKNQYCGLTDNGVIHIYNNNNWNDIIATINFKTIAKLDYNGMLTFTDNDGILYYLQNDTRHCKTDTRFIKNIDEFFIGAKKYNVKEYLFFGTDEKFINNHLRTIDNCDHTSPNACKCNPNYCIFIFHDVMHIHDRVNGFFHAVKLSLLKFNIENIIHINSFNNDAILFIDLYGNIHIYQIIITDQGKTFDFVEIKCEFKTKITKKINGKNARLL